MSVELDPLAVTALDRLTDAVSVALQRPVTASEAILYAEQILTVKGALDGLRPVTR